MEDLSDRELERQLGESNKDKNFDLDIVELV
jgi:hypothetical protein